MSKTATNTDKLRLAINQALHNCLRTATPTVCSMAETKQGYEELERQIMTMCLRDTITPAAAIALLESEYNNAE